MPKKTNKTAHILDLITNGAPSESEGSQEGDASTAEKAGEYKTRSSSKKVKVVDESSRNDQLSGEILSSLTEELKKELKSDSVEQGLGEISGGSWDSSYTEDAAEGMHSDGGGQASGEIPGDADATVPGGPEPGAVDSSLPSGQISADDDNSAPSGQVAVNAHESLPSGEVSGDDHITVTNSLEPGADYSSQPSAQVSGTAGITVTNSQEPGADHSSQPSSPAQILAPAPEADGQMDPPTQEAPAAPQEQSLTSDSAQDQSSQCAIPWSPAHCHISECYFNRNLSEKEYSFVNVMEHLLLRLDLDSFLKEYQVCSCKRCRADVCALALSNLPSKYIVVSSDSLSPLLGYYQNHYKLRLMTELIKACIAVREAPRHSQKDLEVS